MSWSAVFLLTLMIAYSAAQSKVNQNNMISVSPGDSTDLTCGLSGVYITGNNWPVWVHQVPGKGPSRAGISSTPRHMASVSGGSTLLSITKVQLEDEGVYYCCLWVENQYIFGPGTPLNVLTGEAKSPLMSIYPPSEEELKTGKSSTVCLGMDYTPGSATIQWTVDGATQTAGVSPLSISRQSNDRYSASSVLSMSSSDYEKYKQIACTMTHQGKSFVQILKTSECN